MKNIFVILAVIAAFANKPVLADDTKPFGKQSKNIKAEKQISVSPVDLIQEEFLAEVQAYVHQTFEVPARSIGNLSKPQYEVRVYDLSGKEVYYSKADEQADLPAGAELLTVYGNVAYYMLVK